MVRLLIEAESFKYKGGWVVDTLSMETIGSAYLMAHGIGEPVRDAVTDLLTTDDIAQTILYVANLPQHAVVEDVTVFGIDKDICPL